MDDYTRASRCRVCRLTPGLCVCACLPEVALPFELVVLQHFKERASASNTGSLLHKIVRGSRLVTFGDARRPFDPAPLRGPDAFVLYPLPGAPVVSPEWAPACTRLVIPDATWRQARRLLRHLPGFRFVRLPAGAASRLRLRLPPAPGRVSTIEAAAAALRAMGRAAEAARITDAIDLVAPRMLHVRSKLKRNDL